MLNKEIMLTKGKDVSDILIGDAPLLSGDDGYMWPSWFPTESDPFWEFAPGERSSNLLIDTDNEGTSLWIGNPTNATTSRTLTFTNLENGLTATFTIEAGKYSSSYVKGDVFRLIDYPFEKVRMKVYPPPQDTCKKVKKVFIRPLKEGVVNAEKRNATVWEAESREIANSRCVERRIRTSLLKKWNKRRLLWFRRLGISKRPDYVCYSTCSYNNRKYVPGSKDWGLDCSRYIQRCLPRVRQSLLSNKEARYAK